MGLPWDDGLMHTTHRIEIVPSSGLFLIVAPDGRTVLCAVSEGEALRQLAFAQRENL